MGNGSFIRMGRSPSDWNEHIPNEPGLYLLTVAAGDNPKSDELRSTYVKWPNNDTEETDGSLDIYPLYLGATGYLQHRLAQHADATRFGFLGKFEEAKYVCAGKSEILRKNVFVFYIKMPKMVAEWMAAALLATFDFAFDDEEQLKDKIRAELETSIEDDNFEDPWKINRVVGIYNQMIEKVKKNLQKYHEEFGTANIDFINSLNSLKVPAANSTSVGSWIINRRG